jgi:hypothetical protein
MRALVKSVCGGLLIAFSFAGGEASAQRQGQVVVVEGELTPDCPFGICPATNRPRTANDFYILFGYLPPSHAVRGIPTTPPANWPKTYYTPRHQPQQQQPAHAAPQVNVPIASVAPRQNVVPKVNSVPKVAAKPTKPVTNTGTSRVVSLGTGEIARMKSQLKDRNAKLVDELTKRVDAATADAISKLPTKLTPQAEQALRDAIATGDAAAVAKILGTDAASPAGRNIVTFTTSRRTIETVRIAVRDNTLTPNMLVTLVDGTNGIVPGDVLTTIGQIAVIEQVRIWVDNARIGPNLIPVGPNNPIALIPGLPLDTIIPLGGDGAPTLIGIGGRTDSIILGEGNVLQAAGLPAPVGPPVPDDSSPAFASGQIILTNIGESQINYLVNGSQFAMQPKYKQDLEAGQQWTVDFDRGGGNGAAQYELTSGWYEFTPTAKGWELYKKDFNITLENSNDFEFHYVLDNQPRVLAAGRTEKLSGLFPPVIRFDNADGTSKQKQLTDGTYRVALTPNSALEIYPASSIPAPPKPLEMFVGPTLPKAPAPNAAEVGAAPSAVSIPGDDKAMAAAMAFQLPAGFRPIDPVEQLTSRAEKKVAKVKLPPAFTMFAQSTEGGGD